MRWNCSPYPTQPSNVPFELPWLCLQTQLLRRGRTTPRSRSQVIPASTSRKVSAHAASQVQTSESRAEAVIDDLERSLASDAADAIESHQQRLTELTDAIDAEYSNMFCDRSVEIDGQPMPLSISSDEDMQKMAKAEPEVSVAGQSQLPVVRTLPRFPQQAWSNFRVLYIDLLFITRFAWFVSEITARCFANSGYFSMHSEQDRVQGQSAASPFAQLTQPPNQLSIFTAFQSRLNFVMHPHCQPSLHLHCPVITRITRWLDSGSRISTPWARDHA